MWDQLLQNLGVGLITINQGSRPTEGLPLQIISRMIVYICTLINEPGHQGLTDVRVRLIDKCYNETRLRDREAQWAYRLRSIHPLGLNSDDFFCSRSPRRDLY